RRSATARATATTKTTGGRPQATAPPPAIRARETTIGSRWAAADDPAAAAVARRGASPADRTPPSLPIRSRVVRRRSAAWRPRTLQIRDRRAATARRAAIVERRIDGRAP